MTLLAYTGANASSFCATENSQPVQHFPEMLLFGGDPQCWSTDDVVEAFEGYLQRLESGYRPDWFNDASEQRRVARLLPSDVLTEGLSRYAQCPDVLYRLLVLIHAGKVTSCAETVFTLYRAPETSDGDRHGALATLATVATPAQRETIVEDLVTAKLRSHALIADALRVVSLEGLTVEALTALFHHTGAESNFGGNPLERVIKSDLLPAADLPALQKLLTAILSALPGEPIEELTRRSVRDARGGLWMLSVLPDCLLRAVELIAGDGIDAPQVLIDAAMTVERLRHSIYANNEGYRSLRAAIEEHQGFRRRVALGIALSPDVPYAVTRLMWMPGLVCFTRADLDWLLREAGRVPVQCG